MNHTQNVPGDQRKISRIHQRRINPTPPSCSLCRSGPAVAILSVRLTSTSEIHERALCAPDFEALRRFLRAQQVLGSERADEEQYASLIAA